MGSVLPTPGGLHSVVSFVCGFDSATKHNNQSPWHICIYLSSSLASRREKRTLGEAAQLADGGKPDSQLYLTQALCHLLACPISIQHLPHRLNRQCLQRDLADVQVCLHTHT